MSSSPSYPTSRHSRFFEEGIAQTGSLIMTTPGGTPIPATPRTSACPSPGRQSSLYLCLPNSPSRVGHGPCESAKEAELMTNGPPPAELEAALKSSSACHRLWKKIEPSTRKDSQRRTPYTSPPNSSPVQDPPVRSRACHRRKMVRSRPLLALRWWRSTSTPTTMGLSTGMCRCGRGRRRRGGSLRRL